MDPELRPFIEALDVALGKSPEQTGKSRRKVFNKKEERSIGQLGLFVMTAPEEVDEQSDREDLRDRIALVRSPGMVVQYFGKRQVSNPPVVGVFLADDEIDDILRRSEPPEHDRWDANADRLDPAKSEREIVQAIHGRIWHELRTFQKTARPPEKSSGNRFLQLERELAKLFGPTGKREPIGGGKGETPVSLRPDVRISQASGGLKMAGKVLLQLKEEHEGDLAVTLSLRLSSVDETGHHMDPIAVTATFDGAMATSQGEGEWRLALAPGEKVEVAVESAIYESDWTVEFVPKVTPVDGEIQP